MSRPTFLCSTCDESFLTAQEHRRHLKSERHVHILRCRAAAAGTITLPLTGLEDQPDDEDDSLERVLSGGSRSEDESSDYFGGNKLTEFRPENCLFSPDAAASLGDILSHMRTTHGFCIPYQDSLAVDVDTMIWYLHLVVFGYQECISCGTRRRTAEAVQQHMVDKGHCRFRLSDEMAEFYDLEGGVNFQVGELESLDDGSLRLPSGKILSHRTWASLPRQRRRRIEPAIPRQEQEDISIPNQADPAALMSRGRKDLGLAARISRLCVTDQQSLAHLPVSQQRSVLAQQKQQLDSARLAQRRMQSRVERLGNETLMKHFVNDAPGRDNG